MLTLLSLLLNPAQADATVFRTPEPLDYGMAVEYTRLSNGAWITPHAGFGFTYTYLGQYLELSGATRAQLADLGAGWSLNGHLSGGPLFSLANDDLGLAFTPSLDFAYRSPHFATSLGLAAPMQVMFLHGADAVFPVQGEAQFQWMIGGGNVQFHIGLLGRMGTQWALQGNPAFRWEAGLLFGFSG